MKMAGINFYAPVPRVRSESLPACPRPRRIPGAHRQAGRAYPLCSQLPGSRHRLCAARLLGTRGGRAAAAAGAWPSAGGL